MAVQWAPGNLRHAHLFHSAIRRSLCRPLVRSRHGELLYIYIFVWEILEICPHTQATPYGAGGQAVQPRLKSTPRTPVFLFVRFKVTVYIFNVIHKINCDKHLWKPV